MYSFSKCPSIWPWGLLPPPQPLCFPVILAPDFFLSLPGSSFSDANILFSSVCIPLNLHTIPIILCNKRNLLHSGGGGGQGTSFSLSHLCVPIGSWLWAHNW